MQQVCHLRDFSVLEYIKEHNKQQEEKSANTENVFHHRLVRMKALRSRGLSFITDCEGGNEARAIAPNVSIIKFTHSICVTVNGDSVPMNAPTNTIKHAATLTVSWNNKKR